MEKYLLRENSKKANCDILLINPLYNRRLGSGIIPPIGLAYLASFLRDEGFRPRIIDCSIYFDSLSISTIERMKKWLGEELTSIRPKIAIGIGPCTTSAIQSIQAIADTCKEIYPSTPLIFGGPLALIPGQDWLFFGELKASAVVKGDGELPLTHILTRLREGESLSGISGVQTSENQKIEPYFLKDLDSLPYPALDTFKMNCYKPSVRRDLFASPFAPIIGSRGCPFACGFCISGQFIKYRRRSFEKIAKEAEILYKNFGIRSLVFYDDALFPDISKVNEEIRFLAELLDKSAPGILWQIEIRPDVFSNISRDTFEYIFARGCRQLNIGIEKFSQAQLKLLSKPYSTDHLEETCKLVNKVCRKMRLTGTFILGGPGETLSSICETIEFSARLNLLFAHYYPLELYPGTPIYYSVFGQNERAWYDKIISDKWQWGEVIYENANLSATQLMELVSFAYRYFYDRKEWKEIAKRCLGKNYWKAQMITKLWQKDRFRLG